MMDKNYFYTLPFYKKVLYKIKDKIKNIRINYFKLASLLAFVLFIFVLWLFTVKSKVFVPSRDPYDKTGFVNKEDFKHSTVTMDNARFTFELDSETTHFAITDKLTGVTWSSMPSGDISDMPNAVKELFILYYERTLESPKPMSVNNESIKYGKYAFRISDNNVEVLYIVGGKHETTVSDLPQKISVEKMEEKILPTLNEVAKNDSKVKRNLRFLESQYILYETENERYYLLRAIDSSDGIQILYDLLFKYGGYTNEDFAEDSEKFGFEAEPVIPEFEFSVKYTLTDKGLDFKLINDSIVENTVFPIAYIDILPYFGSGNINSDGFMVIPDGSGVLIDYKNEKYNSTYSKKIYGRDNAITSTNIKLPEEQKELSLPMYGVNNNGASFIHLIEEGAAMSYLNAGFKTEYSNNDLKHKYPYINYRYYIRERDAYIFSGLGSNQKVNVWTEHYNKEDFSSKFMFMTNDDQSYVGMAKSYQDYLIEKNILHKNGDTTKEGVFNLTLLGGYKTTAHFFGIPYEKVESLTNTNQAQKIVEQLINNNIENINLSYQGWANDGVKPVYMKDIDFNKVVGSKNDFQKLAKYLESKDINFIPEVYVNTAYTDENINIKKDVIYNMFWDNVTRYDFNLATMLPDKTTTPYYSLLSSKSVDFMKNIKKEFANLGFSSIGLIDHGNDLNSSFHKKNVIFRNDSINYFNQSLDSVKDSFEEVMIRNPYMYAFADMTYALDVPTTGTDYQIINYSIPFIQLVLNGSVDYSGKAFNIDDSNSLEWHKLKAIETGSNLNFTWSHDKTIKLTQTEYSYYYSTYYANWFDEAVQIYHELNELGIYDATLISHEVLNVDASVVNVTYSNGLEIQIDYNNLTYTVLSEVL